MMEEEAKERKSQAKGKPRGERASEGESIPSQTNNDRRTNTVLAKASGTNRKYLEMAEKILDEANRKRSEATKEQPRKDGKLAEKQVVQQTVEQPARRDKGNQAKAAASKTKPLGGRPARCHPRYDSPAQADPTTQRVGQQRTLKGNAA